MSARHLGRLVLRFAGAVLLIAGSASLVALVIGLADPVLRHWSCASNDWVIERSCLPGEARLTALELAGAAMLLGVGMVLLAHKGGRRSGPRVVIDLSRLRRRRRSATDR